jgi:glycosyltransferase involved in cell wall biosynthesis
MSDKFVSLVVCTKDRAIQLEKCLTHLNEIVQEPSDLDITLVDNNSADNTRAVIVDFILKTRFESRYVFCEKPGLGNARNVGISNSLAPWIVFIDDDCYIEPEYIVNLKRMVSENQFSYGSGQILRYDRTDDPRIANQEIGLLRLIPANVNFLPAGTIQGANMFFSRNVFKDVGGFNPLMGPGTRFCCEDIEMAARASMHGFVGALVPDCIVHHHHGRKIASDAANQTVHYYDYGRGAYYASLFHLGIGEPWNIWHRRASDDRSDPKRYERYRRELAGAVDYLQEVNGNTVVNADAG